MTEEIKKPLNEGYQPLQKGYQPSQTIGTIKPPKGGSGQTQISQGQGNTGSDNSQNGA